MLIIRRRAGESILVGDEVEIEVIELGSNRVKIGVHAPRHITVLRKEVRLVREENIAAAALVQGLGQKILDRLRE